MVIASSCCSNFHHSVLGFLKLNTALVGYFCDATDFTGKPCLLIHVQWSSVNLHLYGKVFVHVKMSKLLKRYIQS